MAVQPYVLGHGVATFPRGSQQAILRPQRQPRPRESAMPLAEIDTAIDRARELELELRDVLCLAARGLTDTGKRTSLDELIARCGLTRQELEALPDDD
jgi:hypothetical protein